MVGSSARFRKKVVTKLILCRPKIRYLRICARIFDTTWFLILDIWQYIKKKKPSRYFNIKQKSAWQVKEGCRISSFAKSYVYSKSFLLSLINSRVCCTLNFFIPTLDFPHPTVHVFFNLYCTRIHRLLYTYTTIRLEGPKMFQTNRGSWISWLIKCELLLRPLPCTNLTFLNLLMTRKKLIC